MALVANLQKLGDTRIVRLLDQLHQEFFDAAHQASEIESGLVGVASNGNLTAHLFGYQAHGLEQSGNATVSFGVNHLQPVNFIEAADGRLHDAARLVGGAFRAGSQGFRQHRGVGIHQNAVVPVRLHRLEMHAGNGFRVDAVLFHADTRLARGQHEIVQAHGHTIGDSACQDRPHTLERIHAVASEEMTPSS